MQLCHKISLSSFLGRWLGAFFFWRGRWFQVRRGAVSKVVKDKEEALMLHDILKLEVPGFFSKFLPGWNLCVLKMSDMVPFWWTEVWQSDDLGFGIGRETWMTEWPLNEFPTFQHTLQRNIAGWKSGIQHFQMVSRNSKGDMYFPLRHLFLVDFSAYDRVYQRTVWIHDFSATLDTK